MSEPRSDGGIGKILPLLAPCPTLVGLDSLITVPLIPAIVRETAVAPNLGALMVTAYTLAYAVSAPVFGALSDRSGRRKRTIFFGSLMLGVGTALTGFGGGLRSVLFFRAVTGVGAEALMPGVLADVGDRAPTKGAGALCGRSRPPSVRQRSWACRPPRTSRRRVAGGGRSGRSASSPS